MFKNARWITAGDDFKECLPSFQKKISFKCAVKKATAYITAYGVYDFITNLENELFLARIADTVARIETDEELLASVTIKQVAPNYTYR